MICCVPIVMAACLCWALNGVLTPAPITKDARQNLRAAYNVSAWGVFSIVPAAFEKPPADNYREPVVPFVTSILMRGYNKRDGTVTFEDFSTGRLCRSVKRINLVWAFLVLLGSAVLAGTLTRSAFCAAVSLVLIYACFLRNPEYIDTLCTEIPTAAVMLWVSLLLVGSVRSGRSALFLCAGLLYGVLCLTKAVFLYLALPTLCVVVCCILSAARIQKRQGLLFCVLFMAGSAAVAGPWMLRNHRHFDSFALTQRGGAVLYGRTLRNTMSMDEVVSAVYLWGPGAYKKLVRNTFLDRSPEDFEEGGRAARLNRSADSSFAHRDALAERAGRPEDAVSFHSRGRAERTRVIGYFTALGHPNPQPAADAYMQNKAREWITQHPLRHVMMTVPFAWRGLWCFYGGGICTVLNALSGIVFMAVVVSAVFRGRRDILAFATLPFLLLFFNAFLTHNLSRYSAPAIAHLIISLFVLLCRGSAADDRR